MKDNFDYLPLIKISNYGYQLEYNSDCSNIGNYSCCANNQKKSARKKETGKVVKQRF